MYLFSNAKANGSHRKYRPTRGFLPELDTIRDCRIKLPLRGFDALRAPVGRRGWNFSWITADVMYMAVSITLEDAMFICQLLINVDEKLRMFVLSRCDHCTVRRRTLNDSQMYSCSWWELGLILTGTNYIKLFWVTSVVTLLSNVSVDEDQEFTVFIRCQSIISS